MKEEINLNQKSYNLVLWGLGQFIVVFFPTVVLTAALPGPGVPLGTSGKDGEGKKSSFQQPQKCILSPVTLTSTPR